MRSGPATPGDSSTTFHFADSLYKVGKYRAAGIAYERMVYRSDDPMVRTRALLKKSECQMERKRYGDVPSTLERLNLRNVHDSLAFRVRYQTALALYLNEDFPTASNKLQRLSFYLDDTTYLKRSFYLQALVFNELTRWDTARAFLMERLDHCAQPSRIKDSLRSLVRERYHGDTQPDLKSVKTARTLSSIFPGAGQAYAGFFWDGVTNLTLQAASLAFGVYAILNQHYITAVVLGGSGFQSFFTGGLRHVEYLVEKKNHKLKRTYNESLRKMILKIERICRE